MNRIPQASIDLIERLRSTGHSLKEIKREVPHGLGTIQRYALKIKVLPEFKALLRSKQGGSTYRAKMRWRQAREEALKTFAKPLSRREALLILVALYWGEGTKSELNIINSDPHLLRIFVTYLGHLGVQKNDLLVTLRLYSDAGRGEAIRFWTKTLGVSTGQIANVNILEGKKNGKLRHGMCRIRVRRGGRYFKFIMSVIDLLRMGELAPVV